ncbi:hypothetical protein [Cloacibacillus porcorum]
MTTRVLKRRSVQERTRSERTSSCTLSKYGLLNTRRFPLPSKIGAEKSLVRFYTHQPKNVKYDVDYFWAARQSPNRNIEQPALSGGTGVGGWLSFVCPDDYFDRLPLKVFLRKNTGYTTLCLKTEFVL